MKHVGGEAGDGVYEGEHESRAVSNVVPGDTIILYPRTFWHCSVEPIVRQNVIITLDCSPHRYINFHKWHCAALVTSVISFPHGILQGLQSTLFVVIPTATPGFVAKFADRIIQFSPVPTLVAVDSPKIAVLR